MDADAHRRAAEEDDRQIHHWQEQIAREEQESRIRIQNFQTEIEKHVNDKREHLQRAEQLIRDEEKHEKLRNLERLSRLAVESDEAA